MRTLNIDDLKSLLLKKYDFPMIDTKITHVDTSLFADIMFYNFIVVQGKLVYKITICDDPEKDGVLSIVKREMIVDYNQFLDIVQVSSEGVRYE